MSLREVVPEERTVTLTEAVNNIGAGGRATFEPFSPAVVEFCSALSQAVSRDPEARLYPELIALAFHMRAGAIRELEQEFCASAGRDSVFVPQGTVFHIPPANVDTIFLYSWLLSVLAGNRNIIRLSQRSSPQADLLCRVFRATAARFPAMWANTTMYRYGHELDITAAFSRLCDVRVIWGGDATVNAIREVPLPAHAREIGFPDRFSLAAAKARAVLDLSDPALTSLAERFANDVFWFDQMACSSPRLLAWVGSSEEAAEASRRLLGAVSRSLSDKRFHLQIGLSMEKFLFVSRAAINGKIGYVQKDYFPLLVAGIDSLENFDRSHCGGGLLWETRLDALTSIAPFLDRRDQTLTSFGFERSEMHELIVSAGGRGIDRAVPFGQALNFHHYWDGMDLLHQFTRRVHLISSVA
jgi:hypothetical protein